jgi:hypothetical protein
MANQIQLGRTDNGQGSVTPVGTTLSGAPTLTNRVNHCVAAAGVVAVALPQNSGSDVVVLNLAATAVALTVFPPTAAGKINNGSAGAAFSIAQNKSATFYPHPNGIDYTAVLSA